MNWLPLRWRLWAKLALFGALGVTTTHTMHLLIGRDIAAGAITDEQVARAEDIARLVARQVADAVLVEDRVSMQESVENAVGQHVAWCFVERDGAVVASSLGSRTPPTLVAFRRGALRASGPIIVRDDERRILDVSAPILGGSAGFVRVGLDMEPMRRALFDLEYWLGLVALATILVGAAAALLVGRAVGKPVRTLLTAAATFDPAQRRSPVPVEGSDEFAELTGCFNDMMARLTAAHDEHLAALRKAAATERLVALGSLVAGVAHEINNPLAGLKNVHAAFRRGDLTTLQHRDYVELMGDALGRMEAIVGRLLEYGRPRPLTLRDANVVDLAHEAARLVAPALRHRHVALEIIDETAPNSGRVSADRVQIGQALMNLLLNALFVTADHGSIRLRVRRRGDRYGLAVEDDGPGIAPELRDRVLDPFFSTKPEGEGTGLGLTVTRTIVDSHRGELAFEFPPPGGTVVTVWLRAA